MDTDLYFNAVWYVGSFRLLNHEHWHCECTELLDAFYLIIVYLI